MHNRTIQRRKATRYKWQKIQREQGFSPEECWNLDCTIVEFIIPRLEYLANHHVGYPPFYENPNDYTKDLKDIVYGFKLYLKGDYCWCNNPECKEQTQAVDKAFDLFAKLFRGLWD